MESYTLVEEGMPFTNHIEKLSNHVTNNLYLIELLSCKKEAKILLVHGEY